MMLIIPYVSAEDKLKPVLDQGFKIIDGVVYPMIRGFYFLFPSFEDSLKETMASMDQRVPYMAQFHWIFYLAVFFAVMAVLSILYEKSKYFIINTIIGIGLMLVLIHVLGVELKITLLTLVVTALFGVPGVLFVVMMHYLGIII